MKLFEIMKFECTKMFRCVISRTTCLTHVIRQSITNIKLKRKVKISKTELKVLTRIQIQAGNKMFMATTWHETQLFRLKFVVRFGLAIQSHF